MSGEPCAAKTVAVISGQHLAESERTMRQDLLEKESCFCLLRLERLAIGLSNEKQFPCLDGDFEKVSG